MRPTGVAQGLPGVQTARGRSPVPTLWPGCYRGGHEDRHEPDIWGLRHLSQPGCCCLQQPRLQGLEGK